ncbi:MAG: DUF1902 domain-containing protein [Defluviitaleaceae bacterium]|nr:DUF1902 domain-containing protein [Defluviitaleaceae bacterium]
MKYDVSVQWDEEAGVWCAFCDKIPLSLESNSLDLLIFRTRMVAQEILEINGDFNVDARLRFITSHEVSIV